VGTYRVSSLGKCSRVLSTGALASLDILDKIKVVKERADYIRVEDMSV